MEIIYAKRRTVYTYIYLRACFRQGHARLHGAGGPVEGHGVRLERRLVLLRLHALQAAQGPQPVQAAQDQGQARDRPHDPHDGSYI